MTKNLSAPSVLPNIFSNQSNTKPLPLYNVCFAGHVDAGKSTTATRILFDSGAINPHLIEQYEKEAKTMNKGSFKFAWFLDGLKEERQRGVTINIAHAEWATKNRYYTIIDAPGHVDFKKNTIVGISQADLLVLVVDSKKGLLEAQQTEEHALIARASGITSIIVALTKIDTIPDDSRMSTIKERTEEVNALLAKCGYAPENCMIVPIDSWNGVNISSKDNVDKVLPGYNGPTLFDALDTVPLPPVDESLPFRLSVEDVRTKIGGTSCVITGKVLSGELVPNAKVVVKPSGDKGICKSIQMHYKEITRAITGCNVGVDVKNIDKEGIEKGSILCLLEDRPIKAVSEFTLEKAVVRKHPTQLTVNSNLIVCFQTGSVCAKIKSLSNMYNIAEKKATMGPIDSVPPGCLVDMVLVPDRPIAIDTKDVHPRNSRVLFMDSKELIGWGSVSKIVPSKFEIA